MGQSRSTYDHLTDKIRRFRGNEKRLALLTGALRFFGILCLLCIGLAFTESIIFLPPVGRIVLWLIAAAVLSWRAFVDLLGPLWRLMRKETPALNHVALKIGRFYDVSHDRLANALQLYAKHQSNRESYSLDLVDAHLHHVASDLGKENFEQWQERRPLKRASRRTALVFLLAAMIYTLNTSALNGAWFRIAHPFRDFEVRPDFAYAVLPGDCTVLRGSDLSIRAWVEDTGIRNVRLFLDRWGKLEQIDLARSEDDSFRYEVPAITDSLSYSMTLDKIHSDTFSVSVIELPLLRRLQLRVEPPSYSKIAHFTLDDNVGDVFALKGTRLKALGESNVALGGGELIFEGGRSLPLQVRDSNFEVNFRLEKDINYHFRLRDRTGRTNPSPITYRLRMLPDRYPMVQILQPGRDIDLAEDMQIPMLIEAQDDYGLSRLRLAYQILPQGGGEIDSTRFQYFPLGNLQYGSDQLAVRFNWDLSSSEMLPTDVLLYYAQVFDNDMISGPKNARSRTYRARFPSLYEIYQEIASDQDHASDDMRSIYERSRELKTKFDELSLEMKRATDLDWQQRQEIEEAINGQREIERQLQSLRENLDEMIEKMSRNDLASLETLEKYRQLQRLFQEITTPELQEAMEKVAQAMEKIDPHLLQRAMEQLALSEEEINQSLERSIELLKRLKIEQQIDRALRTASDLAERQQRLESRAVQESAERNALASEQEMLNEELESLDQLLDQLGAEMSDLPGMPEKNIERAGAILDSVDYEGRTEKMLASLKSGDLSQMMRDTSAISDALQQVAQQLQQAKDQMSGEAQRRAMQAMQRSSRELLSLSHRQEELMNRTTTVQKNSPGAYQLAEGQQDLAAALSRIMAFLYESSKDNFAINAQISRALGRSLNRMRESLNGLEGGQIKNASRQQGEAMASLNEAVKNMHNAMQQMMQGSGSGLSFQQFLQQMQNLGQSQQSINQGTLSLGLGKALSMAEAAEMTRLAAEQQRVRKSLEQLAQEVSDAGQILGNMDQIAEEMKEVEQDFRSRQLDRETIERQNRILSRLLDAGRSIREREYSRKRQAETGTQVFAPTPDPLPEDLGEHSQRWLQDLLRARKQGFSRDYLELIQKYYEALYKNNNR